MPYEVEQKYRLTDSAAIERAIGSLGGAFGVAETQIDVYFQHPGRDFRRTDEALRMRSVGESNYVTYKGPKIDATTKTRREIESPLAPGQAEARRFASLLEALGFRLAIEVRKSRRTAHFSRGDFGVEAALDNVDGLGSFVEFEIQADEVELSAARQCLAALARELGLTEPERRGYADLLAEPESP